MSTSPAQLHTLVRSVLRQSQIRSKSPPRFIGVRTALGPGIDAPNDTAVETLEVDGRPWRVMPVRSSLEARRVLVRTPVDEHAILLSAVDESMLGLDVITRLANRRLHLLHPWDAVRERFKATQVDPRVTADPWMASALVAVTPRGGFPVAEAGWLDLDTAWSVLLERLGFSSGSPSVFDLLNASMRGGFAAALASIEATDPEFARRAKARIEWTAGPSGRAVVRAAAAGAADRLVAIGLVLHLLQQDGMAANPVAIEARGRLAVHGVNERDPELLRPWAESAALLVREQADADGLASVRASLDDADRIVHDVHADSIVAESDLLPRGFERRLAHFTAALNEVVAKPEDAGFQGEVETRWAELARHLLCKHGDGSRSLRARAEMAVRLVRWLGTPERGDGGDLASLASRYIEQCAWVDRARQEILAGASDHALISAGERLLLATEARREHFNEAFGRTLVAVEGGVAGSGPLWSLEMVLDRVVDPLVRDPSLGSVLLVVMDGMSHADLIAVAKSIDERRAMRRVVQIDMIRWPAIIAPLPTITEVCRATLLSGELAGGGQSVERAGFDAVVRRLKWKRARGSGQGQPVLFHKGELTATHGSISAAVREAIEGDASVIAVVVNAIDDQLTKGRQVATVWSRESIKPLEGLLDAAEAARRSVVLVADHGHVVELKRGRRLDSEDRPDRWRDAATVGDVGEVVIKGPRVLKPRPGGPVVVPWSERVRYGHERDGYHGGATPQEVVVPLAVWVPENALQSDAAARRWPRELTDPPAWWERTLAELGERLDADPPTRTTPSCAPPPEAPRVEAATTLFETAPERTAPTQALAAAPWIDALLRSPIYEQQRRGIRRAMSADEMRALLEALDTGRGKRTIGELQRLLQLDQIKLRGRLAQAERILNLDGYEVLVVSDAERSATVDRSLLIRQFALEELG